MKIGWNCKRSAYPIKLLLLCACIESNPRPMKVRCLRCNQMFDRQSRLDLHVERSTNISCECCSHQFCSEMVLEQHRRTRHIEEGITDEHSLNELICPDTLKR